MKFRKKILAALEYYTQLWSVYVELQDVHSPYQGLRLAIRSGFRNPGDSRALILFRSASFTFLKAPVSFSLLIHNPLTQNLVLSPERKSR